MAIRKITVSSTQVSDDSNTSTGALDLPVGTTAQRPGSPTSGNIRYNTDIQSTEIYDGTAWGKVSPLTPTLTSVTGNIINANSTTLTLAGTNFLTSNLVVGCTPSGGSETTVTVTPTSQTEATVSVPAAIYGETASTVIAITVTNTDNKTSNSSSKTVIDAPSGGDSITTVGDYKVHTFLSSSTFTNTIANLSVDYLIVGGGGGGMGWSGGGGGAGGLRTSFGSTSGRGASAESSQTLSTTSYSIVVGGPGAAGAASSSGVAGDGDDSSAYGVVASGGGGGAAGGTAGGSGGVGGGTTTGTIGSGTTGQGYDGAIGVASG